jgi:hypothetical protein
MFRAHTPLPEWKRSDAPVGVNRSDERRGRHNVADRIDGADLVERYLLLRHAMDPGFRLRQKLEYGHGMLLYRIG